MRPKTLTTISLSFLLLIGTSVFAETLNGVVTGLNNNEVLVKLNATAGKAAPKAGDTASFMLTMDGLEMDAGSGTVLRVDNDRVWIKVTEGNPDIDMQVAIEASAEASTKMSPQASINTPPTSANTQPIPSVAEKAPRIYSQCVYNHYETGFMNILRQTPNAAQLILKNPSMQYGQSIAGYILLEGYANIRRNPKKGLRYLVSGGVKDGWLKHDKYNYALVNHLGEGLKEPSYFTAALNYKEVVFKDDWLTPEDKYEGVALDHPYAYHNLGCLFLNGRGVSYNREYAINLFTKAARENFVPSIKMLQTLENDG